MTKKTLDSYGDWRNLFVGFDVSNEEYVRIRTLASEKGMSVPVYIGECLSVKDVKVKPSRRAHETITPLITEIRRELKRIGGGADEPQQRN